MSKLDKKLEEITQNALCKELPFGIITRQNMILSDEYKRSNNVTQATITSEMERFSSMSRLIMPADALHLFIEETCSTKCLPHALSLAMPTLIPAWAHEDEIAQTLDASGKFDRRQSLLKFTEDECFRSLDVAELNPEIPLTLMYFQSMMHEYLVDLRNRIATVDLERAKSLHMLHSHWVTASNFVRMFMTAFAVVLPEGKEKNAFEYFGQNLITKGFEFLDDCDAWTLEYPAFSLMGIEARRFRCPARGLLHELMVVKQSLLPIIGKIRLILEEQSTNANDLSILQHSMHAVRQIATMTKNVVKAGGREALAEFTDQIRDI